MAQNLMIMEKGRFKNIIFDIDGTLIDTERTGVESLMVTAKEILNLEMTYADAYRSFGIPSEKVGPMLGAEDPAQFRKVWEQHFIELSHYIMAFPGVEQMIQTLHREGFRMGCVTSRSRFEFDHDIHLKPLLKYFDVEICAEDTLKHKPDPEPALEFLQRLGATAEDTVFIGDTLHDYHCANGAGLKFILADWRNRGLQGIPADFRACNASQMLDILL